MDYIMYTNNVNVLLFCVFVLLYVFDFCTGHFVIVPLNLTCLHCLQQFLNISLIYITKVNIIRKADRKQSLTRK